MLTLHLGVVDIPYGNPRETTPKRIARVRKGKKAPPVKKVEGVTPNETTGDVAEILEEKYHVMRIFFETHSKEIVDDISQALVGSFESLMMGAPATHDTFGAGTSKIEDRFKKFLSEKEMDKLGYPGVPTQAALKGVSHRFKHPYAKRPPRPSFIDTGLYEASMTAWID